MEYPGQALDRLGLVWGREISNVARKTEIAERVASYAKSGDIVGAGSGSTSFLTVLALGGRAKNEGLSIAVVPTSLEIELACHAVGLQVEPNPGAIHWCFDGADEIDRDNRLIKGRGGALYREREVFAASALRFVVADASKSVEKLGMNFPVPVEVEPRMLRIAHREVASLPNVEDVSLRMAVAKDGPVITEMGRVLLDVRMSLIDDSDERRLLAIPGIICTGIFSDFEFERIGDL